MFLKKKHRYKKKKSKGYSLPRINPILIILSMIILLFIGSFIFEINEDNTRKYQPNLGKLLKKNSYENKTGHRITLSIQNGCGENNIAFMYKNFLREEGFDVMDTKNAQNFNYESSKVILHTDNIEIANYISALMGINDSLINIKYDDNLVVDATLIIGKDFDKLSSYDNASLYYPMY